jgi:hypothetical protein
MPAVPGSHLKAFVYDLHLHRLGTDEPLQLGDVRLLRAALLLPLEEGGLAAEDRVLPSRAKGGRRRSSRHRSADERCSESNSRTIWALNAGVKVRRDLRPISYPFRVQYY